MTGDDLAARVRRLEDLEALRRLKADYFAAVDGHDWARLRELLADDCVFTSSARLPPLASPDEFVAFVRRKVTPGRTTHLGFMPRFDFADDDHVTATWSMFDLVEREDDESPGWFGLGTYVEECRRAGEGWVIARWHLERRATRPIRKPDRPG